MKTLLLFLMTTVIATGAMLAAISMNNPAAGIGVSIAAIMLFVQYLSGRAKGMNLQKDRVQLFHRYFSNQQSRRTY